MRIYRNIPDYGACGHYRAISPHKNLKSDLSAIGIETVCSMQYNRTEKYDGVILSRVTSKNFEAEFDRLADTDTKIILDCDDDFFRIPDWSPARKSLNDEHVRMFEKTLKRADRITVSVPALAEALGYPEKTDVLPNLIDEEDWREVQHPESDDVIRILWAGSHTHEKDIAQLIEPIQEIALHADIHVIFYGAIPQELVYLFPKHITFIPPTPLPCYANICTLVNPHIALLPLIRHPFNESKSAIKWYEMTYAGSTVICDPIGPYAAIKDESTGMHCHGNDWYSQILRLAQDSAFRKYLWRGSFDEVRSKHTWNAETKKTWIDWFTRTFP